ncbi:NADPH:quinone reductase-like Zn-dependent oxidoreductase [Kibdelosporangium banguiense]|uniref:NADPH:quinone reductase-like Zn-dependent oxidoreductase n=1 Tax=Kibdelosporangium banguiense TaxID=1365924 RepID=A0ABS4T7M8_9PSEU|nr:zinc-binding dehydrogenase [Kibdelosporangium banguiense]MBP2320414.1 NADPH:quinone reductase-like Zn-dependent oxidoreductase [Kibdelosporangium banguiense]
MITTTGGTVEFADVPEPVRSGSELLVEVSASTVSRGDLHSVRLAPPGRAVGLDVVGVVAEPAVDGSGPSVGTRVMGYAATRPGGWAERAVVDSSLVAPIPDSLSDDVAAALPNSGLAALAGLEAGGFLLGSRVLVTGATGGVGLLAVQLAHLAGAEVTGLVSSPERREQLRAFDWLTTVTAEEAEGPFDLIVDLVGGDVLSRAMSLVAERGVVASLAQTASETASVPFFWFAQHRGAKLVSVYNSDGLREAARGVRQLELLARLAETKRLDPQVTGSASWEQAADLLAALGRRELTGRTTLRIS